MSLLGKLTRCFGISRVTFDTPAGQAQQMPSLASTAVRPLDAPARRPLRQPRADSARPPRGAVPAAAANAARGGTAGAPGGTARTGSAGSTASHALLDAMEQAQPDMSRCVRSLFSRTAHRFGVAADLADALSQVDVSRMAPIPGLPGAPRVLLAQAIAAATGGDATRALDALAVLQEMDPAREVATAWRQRQAGACGGEAGSVYGTPAESLEGSDDGSEYGTARPSLEADGPDFSTPRRSSASAEADGAARAAAARQAAWRTAAALAATPMGQDVLQAVVAVPVEASQRQDFALLLKAAAALPQTLPRTLPEIAEGLAGERIGSVDPAALLARAGARDCLPGRAIACAAARMAGDVQAAQPHRWALAAVRNDLFETGPGSDFAAIDARLVKTGRWIERAAPQRGRLLRNPLVGKTPFTALRHGTQGVERGPAIARHRRAREAALREAAEGLRAHLSDAALRMRTPGPGQAPEALLRAAVLAHCLQAPAPEPLEREGLDAAARGDIAGRLAGMLSPGLDADGRTGLAHRLAGAPALQALATLRLDERTMGQWLDEARAVAGAATQAAGDGPEALHAASAALARAREEVEGRDTRVPVVDRETVRAALKEIIARLEGSSRLRLSSGGLVGVGLRQITSSVSAIASAFFLRGRIDGRVQRGRQAVFEIAMPPYDMEIVLGTQRQAARQVGVGAFVGPDIGLAKAGVNVDTVLYGRERADVSGISLRLPRVGRPVPELRAEFSALVDALLDGCHGGAPPGDGPPLLQRLLQAFPELTVNRIGRAGDGRRRHAVGVDAAASAGHWGAKLSGSVGGFVEAQRNVTKHYADATGHMRVERSIEGHLNKAGVAARVSAGFGTALASTTAASGGVDLSVAALQAGAAVENVFSGLSRRREAVYEAGRLHPLSFVETEYQNVEAFLDAMGPQAADWVDAGIERPRLDALLQAVRQHAAPIHSFAARCTVTPAMRQRDDAYRSAPQLCAQHPGGLPDAAQALAARIESQWTDPAAVQPYSLRSYERHMVQRTRGIDLVVQWASLEAAEASHIDNRIDVPAPRPAPAPAQAPTRPEGRPPAIAPGAAGSG
ncbi:hypothetical protein M5C97_05400 [Acidovorax sp. NCPPB 3859]|nr:MULTISPECIES: hypothetical protein [unclassified Acidovorax]MDA8448655.1 hypothetical protein [Acidovorax sp. GBBC 3297]MDA8458226.1 hypothetical protein [Acidovorax sp. GBBC 3333]MDA8463264.1 hypothetical protein [Acidovorax sp. GBBC 3332]MDA8468131.1 hypothetical protein [Acidovorax sp. GBBC 3299]WCM79740.1 hypothetical protein M5C94_05395 [Acidovorax sp. GBBC 712]